MGEKEQAEELALAQRERRRQMYVQVDESGQHVATPEDDRRVWARAVGGHDLRDATFADAQRLRGPPRLTRLDECHVGEHQFPPRGYGDGGWPQRQPEHSEQNQQQNAQATQDGGDAADHRSRRSLSHLGSRDRILPEPSAPLRYVAVVGASARRRASAAIVVAWDSRVIR